MEFAVIPLLMYFAPTVVAMVRGHHNAFAIFLTNLLLGWSVIGWIIALIWSFTSTGRYVRA